MNSISPKAPREFVSVERLRERLRLEPETGRLFWASHPPSAQKNRRTGMPALEVKSHGYFRGCIDGKHMLAHRVVFALYHGRWPNGFLDHINGNRTDNRPENLREVSHQENCRNKARGTSNSSGVVGVCWDNHNRKWLAYIKVNGVNLRLGNFRTKDEAIAVRKDAESRFGFHPNHGRAA